MKTRQAIIFLILFPLFSSLWGCTPINQPLSTPTTLPPTPVPTLTPSPAPSPTPTPLACLTQPGHVEQDSLESTKPAQEFLIYLPPCYEELRTTAYPVLYLLHGRTYTDDQWVRLGAADAANRLILAGEASPFIIVFPDDRYWNLPPSAGFGERLLELTPYIDESYRTLADRDHRALGGLSRGGGWTVRLGFNHWELFSALGLHSPAVLNGDAPFIETWIQNIPPESRPRLWLDIGDRDKELGNSRLLDETLTNHGVPHEFHLYAGDHSESYWSRHVEEYLRWYAEGWSDQKAQP